MRLPPFAGIGVAAQEAVEHRRGAHRPLVHRTDDGDVGPGADENDLIGDDKAPSARSAAARSGEKDDANSYIARRLALAGGDGMAGGVILLEAQVDGQAHQRRRVLQPRTVPPRGKQAETAIRRPEALQSLDDIVSMLAALTGDMQHRLFLGPHLAIGIVSELPLQLWLEEECRYFFHDCFRVTCRELVAACSVW